MAYYERENNTSLMKVGHKGWQKPRDGDQNMSSFLMTRQIYTLEYPKKVKRTHDFIEQGGTEEELS